MYVCEWVKAWGFVFLLSTEIEPQACYADPYLWTIVESVFGRHGKVIEACTCVHAFITYKTFYAPDPTKILWPEATVIKSPTLAWKRSRSMYMCACIHC